MARKIDYNKRQVNLDKLARLRFTEEVQIKTLGDVIQRLWFNGTNTDTLRNHKKKGFIKQWTGINRTREDCYLLAKEYLPNITYEQVSNAVESFYTQNWKPGVPALYHNYCPTVSRRVHSCYSNKTRKVINDFLNERNLNYEEV